MMGWLVAFKLISTKGFPDWRELLGEALQEMVREARWAGEEEGQK